MTLRPYPLPANKVPVYYAGGAGIDRFRGVASGPGPEDWVGSVTALPAAILPPDADPASGVSRLPDGRSLRDAVAADAVGWLGAALAEAYAEPALLVKLLDAGERLPVHWHPPREQARALLGSPFGKTEAWIILASEPGARIWLGFRGDVELGWLQDAIDRQAVDELLGAMVELEVAPGDVYYLPAGLVHAIGPGILLCELQEPTSFSVLAEYRSFGLDEGQATLGLGWERALATLDRGAATPERLAAWRPRPVTVAEQGAGRRERLLPPEADAFFRAERAVARGELELGEASFAVLVAERGAGELRWDGGTAPLRGGETWVVPAGAGALRLDGDLDVLVCRPPLI